MPQMKFDLIDVPPKKVASTVALLNPDIGPQSRPTARAARIRHAPCSVPLRNAVVSAKAFLSSPSNQLFTVVRAGHGRVRHPREWRLVPAAVPTPLNNI